jgi:hypothetical protein
MLVTLPGDNVTRIGGTLLPVALGLVVGISATRKSGWVVRLSWVAGGLGLGVLAWWFVPTLTGRSLWSAHQEAKRYRTWLDALPPGDLDAYRKGALGRGNFLESFPSFADEVRDAEKAWASRSAEVLEADLKALPAGDLNAYRKSAPARSELANYFPVVRSRLHQAEADWGERSAEAEVTELRQVKAGDTAGYRKGSQQRAKLGEWFPALQPQLRAEEMAWGERTTEDAMAQADALLKTDPANASLHLQRLTHDLTELGLLPAVEQRLRAARRRALLARLENARLKVRALVAEDRFQAAAELARQLEEQVAGEAKAVGVLKEFADLRETSDFLALVAGGE